MLRRGAPMRRSSSPSPSRSAIATERPRPSPSRAPVKRQSGKRVSRDWSCSPVQTATRPAAAATPGAPAASSALPSPSRSPVATLHPSQPSLKGPMRVRSAAASSGAGGVALATAAAPSRMKICPLASRRAPVSAESPSGPPEVAPMTRSATPSPVKSWVTALPARAPTWARPGGPEVRALRWCRCAAGPRRGSA